MKVWEVDPLLCPTCHHEMRIVSLINDAQIIERILRHVGMWASELWNNGVRIAPSTGPPAGGIIECGQLVIEPLLDDPMPDYDSNPPLWHRCDKRDMKRHEKSPWMSPGTFLLLPATRPPPRAGE